MKRYCLKVLAPIILIITISCATHETGKKVIHFVNSPAELTTTIKIPELNDSLKIMQITDAHISVEDEKESDLMKYGERMHKAYMNPVKNYSQDIYKTTFENLDDLLLKAKNENVELLILTGDIVNFPSAASVNWVHDRLMKTGIRWLYISGNHDWHYEGMTGNLDSLRRTWTERSLMPLYNGLNPLFYSSIINGINFVGIDNSTGETVQDQVDFLNVQLTKNEPIVLISHIPYKLESPEQSPMARAINSNTGRIVAILTGHIHRSSFYFTGNLCQYTSLAAFQGGSLTVNIVSD
jgi:predicted MPP superfamily phosphohydrolase